MRVGCIRGRRSRSPRRARRRGEWPPIVPSVVLTEALTGVRRRDYHDNRLLRSCDIHPVDERLARSAARLRAKTTTPRAPSAVDAIVDATVVATADDLGGASILTSDPGALRALARNTVNELRIAAV